VVPEKRKLMVVGAAIAAAFALTGCAPAGLNGNSSDYGAQPAANAVDVAATPTPGAEVTPGAEATDGPGADDPGAEDGETPELSDDEVTTELNAVNVKRMGETVQNEEGFVLYRFDDDKTKPEVVSNCNGDCAKVWPPAVVNKGEKPKLKGVDPELVGTVTRKDGTQQLTIEKWPVYTYIGDKKPGQWKGQNVGGKWFVITPEGKKNLTCLPKISKPVAPPADNEESGDSGGDAGGDSAGSDYSY
jgi:predicted lipoprotein with Yx(FWY)xxD motif